MHEVLLSRCLTTVSFAHSLATTVTSVSSSPHRRPPRSQLARDRAAWWPLDRRSIQGASRRWSTLQTNLEALPLRIRAGTNALRRFDPWLVTAGGGVMFRSAHSCSFLRVSSDGSRRAAIRATLFFLLIVVFVSLPTLGQQVHILPRTLPPKSHSAGDAANQPHSRVFRTRTDLVLVPVTVTDSLGRLVTGLDKDSFQ